MAALTLFIFAAVAALLPPCREELIRLWLPGW